MAGTTILELGDAAGEAYEPVGWELWTPVAALYNEGRYAEAAQRTRELVLANPGLPMLVYMLACRECRAGHTQAAIEHLRVAVVSKRMRVIAANDSELDALHDEPAFKELIGSGP